MTWEPSPPSWGRLKVREALRFALSRRDRFLPTLREMRNMFVDGPGGPLAVRLYVPMGAAEVGPLLIYFHGGGFVCCDLDTHDALCTRLADAGQFRILSCSYRLAPEASFPAQEHDALATAQWAIANAAMLGADPARIGIGGDSAGGYLAARMAKVLPGAFRAQILIYPLMHLEDDVWAGAMVSDGRALGRLAVRAINAELGGAPVHAPSLLADGALAAVPAVIVAGARLDPCRPDCIAAHDQLESLGVSVAYRDFAGLTHGFGNMTHLQVQAREVVAETGYLARLMLGAP
jgi:acetyl esterase